MSLTLKTAAIKAVDDDGNTVGGPYFVPLTDESKTEIHALAKTHGAVQFEKKPEQRP